MVLTVQKPTSNAFCHCKSPTGFSNSRDTPAKHQWILSLQDSNGSDLEPPPPPPHTHTHNLQWILSVQKFNRVFMQPQMKKRRKEKKLSKTRPSKLAQICLRNCINGHCSLQWQKQKTNNNKKTMKLQLRNRGSDRQWKAIATATQWQ